MQGGLISILVMGSDVERGRRSKCHTGAVRACHEQHDDPAHADCNCQRPGGCSVFFTVDR